MIKQFKILVISSFYIIFINTISTDCQTGCQQCVQSKSTSCVSCRNQFQLSNSGQCISNTIQNCINYSNSVICSKCRPSFRLLNNRCVKMYDGCIQSRQVFNLCQNCLQTSILNKMTSTCQLNELNCEQLGRNRKCIKCKQNYKIDVLKNICICNSSSCIRTQQNTGLCVSCSLNYTLLGYQCIKNEKLRGLLNCYLTYQDSGSGNPQCKFCKQGYSLINGICNLKSVITNANLIQKCSQKTQYVQFDSTCKPIPQKCKFFDYGLKKCVFCQAGRALIDGICRKDVQKNCQKFSANDFDRCESCKSKFYLNQDFQCISFPPYCEIATSSKCNRCIDSFMLNNRFLCVDPNCLQLNLLTAQCIQCNNSYVKDLQGICMFVDPNCEQRDNSVCVKCKQNFQPNAKTGICQFIDPNCLNSSQGKCLQCNISFYYNRNAQRCLKLPDFCFISDEVGNCRQCRNGYVLTTTSRCVKTNSIPNCRQSSDDSPNVCKVCQAKYYINSRKTCDLLPLFCVQFDVSKGVCKACDTLRSTLEVGICKDKNCQYIDSDGTCFGCYQGYQFGPRGQCNIIQKDRNCKQFQFDQCKTCSDRYYFDKQFRCIPVSTLCRQFDQNSGLCTSCYQGYILSQEPQGQCVVGVATASSKNIFKQLISLCKTLNNKTMDCDQCIVGYQRVHTEKNKTICTKKLYSGLSSSCIESNNKNCTKCKNGSFLNNAGECVQTDQNCATIDFNNGSCAVCLDGYQLKIVETVDAKQKMQICLLKQISNPDQIPDLNCKQFDKNNTNLCKQCYPGYSISSQFNLCIPLNDLCQNRDQKTGNCQKCYDGYSIQNGSCVISLEKQSQSTSLSKNCKTKSAINNQLCGQCNWGYLSLDGVCFQKDPQCKSFKNQSSSLQCSQCYSGYSVHPVNRNKCVLGTQIDSNCVRYDDQLICQECKPGYQFTNQSKPRCQLKFSDQMCELYKSDYSGCEKCIQNAIVVESGKCDYPLHGFDLNCQIYQQKICTSCKLNYQLVNLRCQTKLS